MAEIIAATPLSTNSRDRAFTPQGNNVERLYRLLSCFDAQAHVQDAQRPDSGARGFMRVACNRRLGFVSGCLDISAFGEKSVCFLHCFRKETLLRSFEPFIFEP